MKWPVVNLTLAACLFASPGMADNKNFGAIAVGLGNQGFTSYMGAGIVTAPTPLEAETGALATCQTERVPTCTIVEVFGDGDCRFISLGEQPDAVIYGTGPTAVEALGACVANGGEACSLERTRGLCSSPAYVETTGSIVISPW